MEGEELATKTKAKRNIASFANRNSDARPESNYNTASKLQKDYASKTQRLRYTLPQTWLEHYTGKYRCTVETINCSLILAPSRPNCIGCSAWLSE